MCCRHPWLNCRSLSVCCRVPGKEERPPKGQEPYQWQVSCCLECCRHLPGREHLCENEVWADAADYGIFPPLRAFLDKYRSGLIHWTGGYRKDQNGSSQWTDAPAGVEWKMNASPHSSTLCQMMRSALCLHCLGQFECQPLTPQGAKISDPMHRFLAEAYGIDFPCSIAGCSKKAWAWGIGTSQTVEPPSASPREEDRLIGLPPFSDELYRRGVVGPYDPTWVKPPPLPWAIAERRPTQ